ncbi:hypothetical protein BH11CYA1_BH11CYA1_16510 [soil metagenome]
MPMNYLRKTQLVKYSKLVVANAVAQSTQPQALQSKSLGQANQIDMNGNYIKLHCYTNGKGIKR